MQTNIEDIKNHIEVNIDEATGDGEIKALYVTSGEYGNGQKYKFIVGIYRKIKDSKQYWGFYKSRNIGYISLKETTGNFECDSFKNLIELVNGWNIYTPNE